MFFINNKKGFTLFTALVSLLLISITLVLLFNMIRTEETYLSLISNQSSMSDLITIGDLARADAFDTFIVSLRYHWESTNSNPEQAMLLERRELDANWTDFVQLMANKHFFSQSFAKYFATALLLKYQNPIDPPGYKVELKRTPIDGLGDYDAESGLHNQFYTEIVNQMFVDGGKRIDVVNCDNENALECTGSFYITIDATKIADENYEKLPKINILRHKSQDVIQRPIFGRQIYKIYFPWRGFQALKTARRIAHSTNAEISDNPALFSGNIGLFNSKIHNTLEQARLGVCEPKSCDYRKDLFKTVTADGFSKSCVEPEDEEIEITPIAVNGTFSSYNPPLYESYNIKTISPDGQKIFTKLIDGTISVNLSYRSTLEDEKIVFNNGLKLIKGFDFVEEYGDVNIFNISVLGKAKRTKQISERHITQPIAVTSPSPQSSFSIDNPVTLSGGLGLSYDQSANTYQQIWDIDNSWNNQQNNLAPPGEDNFGVTGQSITFNCYELEAYEITLKFEETDDRYRTLALESNETNIWVKIKDSFLPFTFPPKSGSNYGYTNLQYIPNTGYFKKDFILSYMNPYWNDSGYWDDWKCYSNTGQPDLLDISRSCTAN